MEIPRYWRSAEQRIPDPDGRWVQFKAWGWSSENESDARTMAQTRLKTLADRLAAREQLPRRYAYGSRPLREEILNEISDSQGDLKAVITRNSYGSRILNTDSMLFIDVDVSSRGPWAGLKRLFGRESPPEEGPELDRLRGKLERLRPHSFRIYQTAAGFRAMGVSRTFQPDSDETQDVLRQAGSDPAFAHLCRLQKSFRARLTPKFWRCGMGKKPPPFPRDDMNSRDTFRRWLETYEERSGARATCRLLETVGSEGAHEELESLIQIHDSETRVGDVAQLA